MSKVCKSSFLVMALSGFLGSVSLILFGIFLYTGLPSQMNLGLSEQTNLYFDALLCFLFFLQHSLMIRNGLTGFIPQNYHGAFFSIFSGIFLLILMLFWQKSTAFQFDLDGAAYFFMRALFFLSIIGYYVTIRSLRPFDPFGIREIIIHLKGKTAKAPVFTVRGTYRWVRHPLYFFSLLLIWATVSVTTDRLLFNGLWTVWIIVGAMLEERDLVASFGDAYRNYQRNVPMLIPYKWRPWRHVNN
jgi:protein-S-isoprenylcysteine O-methyltransferase Ste14